MQFILGRAAAEYIFAQDLPPSVFFPVTAEYPNGGRPGTDRLSRVQETALGDLFTDAAAWYVRKYFPGEHVDFVFLNGGYIDNALPQGKITLARLAALISSASDKLYFVTLKGAELTQFFNEVADLPPHTGRGSSGTGWFGIVSGEVRYTLEYYKPPVYTGGAGLTSDESEPYYHGFIRPGTLKINGSTIVDSQDYRICTTDYNIAEHYFTRLTTDALSSTPTGVLFWHTVAAYIYDKETVTPKTDGRIKLQGGVPLPPPWTEGDLIKP
jgi:2',3'-cyclic-nucleotide 2'-phosphodiesterase (5'-nucleotidase family)